ncbi:Fpg/Nei family DNA glycosylase [Rhodohalobacter sp. 8-1]|uniref:Fpg/Nei family DNA glycosylase n=1 Tax=Rhodohalobacter sp. 8-1 TaxID=3131972 RepID=UPI0030ECCF76
MPELPDVQVYKEYIDATSLHQSIESIDVMDARILRNVSKDQLIQTLSGQPLDETHRHGKYLFIHTGSKQLLMMHFGMTGSLKYYKEDSDEPEYTQVRFDFDNGYHLAYVCKRMLGQVQLVEDIKQFLSDHDIGPDALRLNRDEFRNILGTSRAMIKPTFMDQSKLAGIGNEYSDEILFQAGIHPRKQATDLNSDQLDDLFDQTHDVCTTAIENRIEWDKFPDSYLVRHREKGANCPICGGTIDTMKINSRTCYYCPQHQSQ